MNYGVASLNETARNMTKKSNGIGDYKKFAIGGEVEQKDEYEARDQILQTIYEIESNNDYDRWNDKVVNPPSKPLTTLTVQEIMDFQKNNKGPAAGAGQIKYDTLKYLIKYGTIKPTDVFSPDLQDKANNRLLDRRGFVSWLDGDTPTEVFGSDLAQEWASLPLLEERVVNGKRKQIGDSRYSGSNKALIDAVSWKDVLTSASEPIGVADVNEGILALPVENVQEPPVSEPTQLVGVEPVQEQDQFLIEQESMQPIVIGQDGIGNLPAVDMITKMNQRQ